MIEKQRKLYRIGGKLTLPDQLIEPPKVTIKIEPCDNYGNVFVDCSPSIPINELKQEAYEKPHTNKKKYHERGTEVGTNDERQELLQEFKQLLKQNMTGK